MTIFPALNLERKKQRETIWNKIERQKIVCLVQRTGARVTNSIH